MSRFTFALCFFASLFFVPSFGATGAKSTLDTCVPVPRERMVRFVLTAERATGVPSDYIGAVLLVETKFGTDMGPPGSLVLGSNIARDGIPVLALAHQHGYNPYTACASQSSSGGGGAIGPGRILASTWMVFSGMRIDGVYNKSNAIFSSRETTNRDVLLLQSFLNLFMGAGLDVSGTMNPETDSALADFRLGFMPTISGPCARETSFGPCAKIAILNMFRLDRASPRNGSFEWRYRYDPANDHISRALGISEPSNPWNPEHSVMATALILREIGVLDNFRKIGGYYAGPAYWNSPKGIAYHNKVMDQLPIAQHIFFGVGI